MNSRVLWIACGLSVLLHVGFGLFMYLVEPPKKSERIVMAMRLAEELQKDKQKAEIKKIEEKKEPEKPKKIEDTTPKPVKKEEAPKITKLEEPKPKAEPKKVEERTPPPSAPPKLEPAKPKPPVPASNIVKKGTRKPGGGKTPTTPGVPINTDFTAPGGGGGGGGVEVPVGDGYYGDGSDSPPEMVLEGEFVSAGPVVVDETQGGDVGLTPEGPGGGPGKGVGGGGPGGGGSGNGGDGRPSTKPKPKTETVAKVSKPAKVSKQVKVEYPDELKTLDIQGRVKLELVVDEKGKVDYVAVKQGLHPKLDAIAVEAAWKLEFEPALKDDVAVKTTIPYTFTFVLE